MTRRASGRGSGLIEFALLVLILMLLALGVFNLGLAIEAGDTISAAARAGAFFGASDGNANNTSGMQNAALNSATGLTASMTANASTWCTCTAGSATTVSCTSLCNTYGPPIQYVKVQTSATIPLLFNFPGVPLTIPLGASFTLRAR
jgi:Flp pilus assembly protein TadG